MVIFDSSSSSLVLSSKLCDSLCNEIARFAATKFNLDSFEKNEPSTVFILSELISAGGHIELLKDYISSGEFVNPCIIITDIFFRQDANLVTKFSKEYEVDIYVQYKGNYAEKLLGVSQFIAQKNPDKIILLNHHQDVVAIVGALMRKKSKSYFIHHADHNLALGVTCQEFQHVDIHSMGFWNCRDELKLKNTYWPMTARDFFQKNPYLPLANKKIVTCSSGRYEKFIPNGYGYDYFALIPKIVSHTGGSHVHIGPLPDEILSSIGKCFELANLAKDSFVHIDFVPSLSRALYDLEVDLYIPSFPVGGGKACMEAMSAGIPLLMHHNYSSRLLSGIDLVYPDVWTWENEATLYSILKNLTNEKLKIFSKKSREHYELNYSPKILSLAIKSNFDNLSLVPKLRNYEIDEDRIRLDKEIFTKEALKKSHKEIHRVNQEWLKATIQRDELQVEINRVNQEWLKATTHRDELQVQLNLMYASLSWRATKPLRAILGLFNKIKLNYFK